MISFKQFLTESKSAPLYHATRLMNAEKILRDNTLFGTMQEHGYTQGKKGIFLTRSLKHARHIYGGEEKVIFVIDQLKLNQRYKIKPIKNWPRRNDNHAPQYMTGNMGGNEFEEFVETNKITDIDNYIVKIYVQHKIDPAKYPLLTSDERVEYI